MTLRFRPEARADLIAIALYLAERAPRHAERVVAALEARCAVVARNPLTFRLRPEFGPNIRALPAKPYMILYRIVGDDTEIVAIVHGARDLPRLMRQRSGEE